MEGVLISVYVLGLLAAITASVADGFLNQWAKYGGTQWLIVGYALSALMIWFFANMLKREELGFSVMLFVITNSIVALMVSRFYFNERLAGVQWIGVSLALVALFLLSKGK